MTSIITQMNNLLKFLLVSAAGITASANATASQPARIGERNPLKPPFCEVFDDYPSGSEHSTFENRFVIIDSNNDGRSWWFYNYNGGNYSKCAYLLYPIDAPSADDWLIPRAIQLEEGKYYYVNMDASLYTAGGDHTFEVWMGRYSDAEGMDTRVIPTVHVSSTLRKHVGGWFRADEDGIYYMGIHGITLRTSTSSGYLFIDNIAIDAAKQGGEPAEISALGFVNDPTGEAKVTLKFTAPQTTIDGSALTENIDIIVRRNGTVVGTVTDVVPGNTASFIDSPPALGNYTYSVSASNSVGEGAAIGNDHYVGLSTPCHPEITSFVETSPGRIEMQWEAPATDISGNAISPSIIEYNIYDMSTGFKELLATITGTTTYSEDIHLAPSEQQMVIRFVSASINGDESQLAGSDQLFIGTPYTLPYNYSFHETGGYDFVLGASGDDGISWSFLDDFSDPRSQDGDGGYICMIGTKPGTSGELSTGKIYIPENTSACATFYTYVYPDDYNTIEFFTLDCESGERTFIASANLQDYAHIGWNRLVFPLTDFGGKTVRLIIRGSIVTHGYIPIDNMSVYSLSTTDMTIDLLDYTPYAESGEEFSVTVRISNLGSETAGDYTVSLMCGDRSICSVTGPVLESFGSTDVILKGQFLPADETMPTFRAKVDIEADSNPDDNITRPFAITFLAPNHPTPTGLTATETEGSDRIELSWGAPDLSQAAPMPSTEDFESYPAFTTELNGGWTMADIDQAYICGFNGYTMPVDQTQQAWWTMQQDSEFNFIQCRGNSSLVQMASVNDSGRPVVCDDWIISPLLYGGRQTVSFYARSLSDNYGYETFEVYYSTSGNSVNEMQLIMPESEVPVDWTQYFVSLPDGTTHFAIRCTSDDRYMMLLDDITYITPGEPRELTLEGYNVYRNNVKINDLPVSATTFTTARELDYDTYYVTAVYSQGESTASNLAHAGQSGISTVIANDAPVEFYDLRGLKVAPGNLRPGIYLRRQGASVSKIIIR